jgi:hypothetical protein
VASGEQRRAGRGARGFGRVIGFEDAIRAQLKDVPTMPATVIAERVGCTRYGNYYFKRAVVTLVGLGANPAEDAVYPLLTADADGEPPTGDHDYVIHFDADELPPAYAFWSVTMYDAEGFQVANQLNRFAIGDRDPLRLNAGGSLDLYLQHINPGPDRESNWLPAPLGPLGG